MHLIVKEVVFYLYYERSLALGLIDVHYLQKCFFFLNFNLWEVVIFFFFFFFFFFANQQVNPQIILQ